MIIGHEPAQDKAQDAAVPRSQLQDDLPTVRSHLRGELPDVGADRAVSLHLWRHRARSAQPQPFLGKVTA